MSMSITGIRRLKCFFLCPIRRRLVLLVRQAEVSEQTAGLSACRTDKIFYEYEGYRWTGKSEVRTVGV